MYDLIGIGFGPSNVSLNICLNEKISADRLDFKFRFFEKKTEFDWHSGMLLPDADMQVSFFKDLVFQRNPRSKYTFVNFLFETGRLTKFINYRRFHPSRSEFVEYLKWVVTHFENNVTYNTTIKCIRPHDTESKTVKSLSVIIEDNITKELKTYVTKGLSVAVGGKPNIPKMNKPSDRVIHSMNFLHSLKKIDLENMRGPRIAVVGAGQSAIEMLLYLYEKYPHVKIDSIVRGSTFHQSDSSLFVNEVFFNENVDTYFYGNSIVKNEMILRRTNYAVADEKELEQLYRIYYNEAFFNRKRLQLLNLFTVKELNVINDKVSTILYNRQTEEYTEEKYDYVFLGTGFKRRELDFLKYLDNYLYKVDGEYKVNRDYSLQTTPDFHPKIYVQGHTENQHGITNTLLSVIALRVDEIVNLLVKDFKHSKSTVKFKL